MDGTQLLVGAFATPWPGTVLFKNDQGGALLGQLHNNCVLGVLSTALMPAASHLWDHSSQLQVEIYDGHLSSVTSLDVLNGLNQIAVQKNDGQCEIVGFEHAQLLGAGVYRLSGLLRGQSNTIAAVDELADAGNAIIFLTDAIAYSPVTNAQLDQSLDVSAFAGSSDLIGQGVEIPLLPNLAKPFAPVHAKAKQMAGTQDISITWHRRTQIGGDSWSGNDVPLDFSPEMYLVSMFDGAVPVRQITCSMARATYSSAQQIDDFGAALSPFVFEVSQISAVQGTGAPVTGSFTG